MLKLWLALSLYIFWLFQFPPPPPLPTATFTPTPPFTPTFTPTSTPVPAPTATPMPGPLCLAAVEGNVQDAQTGAPIQGIVVELKGDGWKAQTATSSNGVFRFYGLCYGVGELALSGFTVVEGETKVFLDGKSTVRVSLKVRSMGPTPTPTPGRAQVLPKTGNAWLTIAVGLAFGILAMAINRLRHFVRRSN